MKEIPTVLFVVAAAIAGKDGRWLLHRRPPHKHHGGLWEFPGGKLEQGEFPRAGLVRELKEELGIGVREADLVPCAFADGSAGEGTGGEAPAIVIFLYTLTAWEGEARALEPGAEIGWFTSAAMQAAAMPPLDIVLRTRLAGAGGVA